MLKAFSMAFAQRLQIERVFLSEDSSVRRKQRGVKPPKLLRQFMTR
jgi:hypothetical protein